MKVQIFNLFLKWFWPFLKTKNINMETFFSIDLKPQKKKINHFGEFLLIKRRVVTKATSI